MTRPRSEVTGHYMPTTKNLVGECLASGVTDRQEISEQTGLTRLQVKRAMFSINSHKDTKLKANKTFSGVNSIFNMG